MSSSVYLSVLSATLFFSSIYGSAQSTGKIGDSCYFDGDCNVTESYCKDRTLCSCRLNYTYNSYTGRCLKVAHYNEQCEEEDQCQDSNTYCYQGKCQCKPNFIRKGDACLIKSNLDDCFSDYECSNKYPNTHCMSRNCVCDKGYVESNRDRYTCLPESHYNEKCQESFQCTDNNTVCMKGVCQHKSHAIAAYNMSTSSVWLIAIVTSFLVLKK